jgi:hypothetical protein
MGGMREQPRVKEPPFSKQRRGSLLRDIERAAARDFHQPRKSPGLLETDDGSLDAFSKREALLAWREIEAARDHAEEQERVRRLSVEHSAFGSTLESLELNAGRSSPTGSRSTPTRIPQA